MQHKLKFDEIEFANTYLSTVFGALLIGLVLQIFDLYKSSNASYSKLYNIICSLDKSIESIIEKLKKNETNMTAYSNLLEHYKSGIESSFTTDNETNEKILEICRNPELLYIIESFRNESPLSDNKKSILIEKGGQLSIKIKSTIEEL